MPYKGVGEPGPQLCLPIASFILPLPATLQYRKFLVREGGGLWALEKLQKEGLLKLCMSSSEDAYALVPFEIFCLLKDCEGFMRLRGRDCAAGIISVSERPRKKYVNIVAEVGCS